MSQAFLEPYPDVEDFVMALLDTELFDGDDTHTAVELPDDYPSRLPFGTVIRTPAPSQRLQDFPVVDISWYAATRAVAYDLATRTEALLSSAPLTLDRAGHRVTLDRTEVLTAPLELPWEDTNIRRFGSTYRFSVRRR